MHVKMLIYFDVYLYLSLLIFPKNNLASANTPSIYSEYPDTNVGG